MARILVADKKYEVERMKTMWTIREQGKREIIAQITDITAQISDSNFTHLLKYILPFPKSYLNLLNIFTKLLFVSSCIQND